MALDTSEFTARNYQVELMKIALSQNTIIFLPTGSGKTYIAIMILKQMSEPLAKNWLEDGKVTIMVVNTVALVHQHGDNIRRHTPFKVGEYTGEHNLDFWEKNIWDQQCTEHQVLIMTAQILSNGLERNVLDLNKINLLIFDECHRGVQDQPMRQIMMNFQHAIDPPRVLGLTATLLNGNCTPGQVERSVAELEVTFHSKVATVDELSSAQRFSTNPNERIISYINYNLSNVDNTIVNELNHLIHVLLNVTLKNNQKNDSPHRKELSDPNKDVKELANIIKDTIYHLEALGSYGGLLTINAHLIQIQCIKKKCTDSKLLLLINGTITSLTFCKLLLRGLFTGRIREDIIVYSSPKVITLLNILSTYRKNNSLENFCSIIFVQRRFTAKVLYQLLKLLAENDENFSFIKSNFVVGYTANPLNNTREAMYGSKVNRTIIKEFYAKSVNLLVASNVLEEGVDVPMCQLIIKFDEPKDYRAYIQSKGRARHKESYYYIMVEETSLYKYKAKYAMFQELEQKLNDYLIGKNEIRSYPDQKQINEMYNEHEIEPYYTQGPGSAQINMVSACSLLSSYCNSFMADIYTQYAPNWYIEFGPGKTCRVIIELPTVCPYVEPIEGPFMPNKKSAKRAAAFTACKLLHQIKELDDNLRPKKQTVIEEDTNFLFPHYKDERANVAKEKRNVFDIKIPNCCKGTLTHPYNLTTPAFLHVLEIKSKFKATQDYIKKMANLYDSDLTFALISSKPFHKICEFPIYVSGGELSVKLISNYQVISLTNFDVDSLKQFTHFVYSDLLQVLKTYLVVDNEAMILLAPYNKSLESINHEVIYDMRLIRPSKMSTEECSVLDVCEETYNEKIVIPFYRSHMNYVEYVVMRVCYELSPISKFPSDKDGTFYDYFKSKYQYCIKKLDQPLLEVKALSSKLDCTKPRGAQKKRNRDAHENDVIHLVPEMVTKQSFPSCLWVQSKILPTICDKIIQLLRAEELRVEIHKSTKIGVFESKNWSPLKLDNHLINYEANVYETDDDNVVNDDNNVIEDLNVNIKSIMAKMSSDIEKNTIQNEYPWDPSEEPVDIDRKLDVTLMEIQDYMNFIHKPINDLNTGELIRQTTNQRKLLALTYNKDYIYNPIQIIQKEINQTGPELCDIYKALTMAKSDDIVNLERLETLGDSLLKFTSSLYIIIKFPMFNEGTSTSLKSQLVSNKNLLILGCQKNLGNYIKFFSLKPKQDWTPPGYILPENISKFFTYNNSLNDITLSKSEQLSGNITPQSISKIFELQQEPSEEESIPVNTSTMFFMGKQCLSNKSISDCSEALIGAYLESCGIKGGLNILNWLGVFPQSEDIINLLQKRPSTPILNPTTTQKDIDFHIPQYRLLEEALGYQFKNRAYLLQAVTHSSYTINRVTGSYQRLEFLGDAILDFLITCHIYENCQKLTPGDITDLRSALVNNVTFACLTIRCGFHKHLLAMSNKLQAYIDRFVRYQENKNFAIDDEVVILLNEDDYHIAEYIDVPKVLGDLFEALAGAVYLDSDMNLETVWRVFHRIMWKEIEKFSNKVPKNSIRMLYETVGAHPKFQNAKVLEDGRVMVKLNFLIDGEHKSVHGFGDHQKVAKKAAAKIALRLLEK
nr:endoribonuclease Dicer-like [Onthophagus taurus]XP_022903593.1 endoribonuclease Dicer-like [Onthophagus taurus]